MYETNYRVTTHFVNQKINHSVHIYQYDLTITERTRFHLITFGEKTQGGLEDNLFYCLTPPDNSLSEINHDFISLSMSLYIFIYHTDFTS